MLFCQCEFTDLWLPQVWLRSLKKLTCYSRPPEQLNLFQGEALWHQVLLPAFLLCFKISPDTHQGVRSDSLSHCVNSKWRFGSEHLHSDGLEALVTLANEVVGVKLNRVAKWSSHLWGKMFTLNIEIILTVILSVFLIIKGFFFGLVCVVALQLALLSHI